MSTAPEALKRAGLRTPAVRGPVAELGVKSANGAQGTKRRVLHGAMVPFDEWIRIDSIIEGKFYESWAPGSCDKTFAENRSRMRVLCYHGKSGTDLGRLPIGTIIDLHADSKAAHYEVELFNGLPEWVLEGIEAGEYGTSVFYELVQPKAPSRSHRSEHNPEGWDELRILEAKIIEFGPTPFALYPSTSAALRSMTDDVMLERLADDPDRLSAVAERMGMKLVDAPQEGERSEDVEVRQSLHVGENVTLSTNPNATAGAGPSATVPALATVRTTTENPRARRRHERACQYVETSAWMLHPATLSTIIQIIGERASGYRPTKEEIAERIATLGRERAVDDEDRPSGGPVRVIPISGTLVPHSGMFADVSEEGRAVEDIRAEMRAAMNDDEVQAILLDVDSPGGSAELIPELASDIRAMREEKPITAIANTFAASAAYYLASQANEVVVTQSGYVGSIGVYTIHDDLSAKLEADGISKTIISSGKFKVEGNPFQPLSDEARDYRQEQIDEIYKLFVADVAKGRGVKASDVEADFGQGRMVQAAKAVERGMADRVATFDQTLKRLEKSRPASSTTRAAALSTSEPEPTEATTPQAASRRTREKTKTTPLKRKEPKWLLK